MDGGRADMGVLRSAAADEQRPAAAGRAGTVLSCSALSPAARAWK